MGDGVVTFGVQKLWNFLSQQSERLRGVDEQVSELRLELGRLQSLLKDADAKKYESERVRNFLEDVKDIVYDAEDTIESFLLEQERAKEKGIKKHVKRVACFLVDRRKFALDIKSITKRISEVIARMQSFGIQQIIDGTGGSSLSLQERQREIRQMFPNNSDNDLVGLEQSVEELVGHLVGNNNIQVVSITGMGGIGKTTLAREVYHHDMVRRHFDGFAWVCVSQRFTQKHVWQRILKDLRPHDDGDISHMDEYTLQNKLFKLLETNRYLIVLDDVWKEEDWDRIKAVFPRKRGWNVLLTSRNESVGVHADPTCFAFKTRTLTSEDSWTLCSKIAFPRRDDTGFRVGEELEAMGKNMITFCGGLPLAVKVLGGLLATKHTVPEWKRVYDNIRNQIIRGSCLDANNPSSVYRVLSLSYEDLPMCLQHCFLYLAHFPEDYEVYVDTLFYYWAAEGMIMPSYPGATVRDSAEGYLEELVRRNMVIAETRYETSKFEKCHMHDIMREVCLSKAEEENFLQIVKAPTTISTINVQSPSRSRRLGVHSGSAFQMLEQKCNPKVRALLCFGVDENFCIQPAQCFKSLPLLRVLDLSRVKFEGGKLPSSIGELIHLRFLSLFESEVSHLPSSLGNLKLLLYLNLYIGFGVSLHVPNVLKEMLELRYVTLPYKMPDSTKLELGNLVKLECLWHFSTKQSSITDLLHMTRLQNLVVYFHDECTLETLSSYLSELRDLQCLGLFDVMHVTRRVADVGEFIQGFIHLKVLMLGIHMPRLSDQHRFPPHLKHIFLQFCHIEEDPMPILEKLFHLKTVELSQFAFAGRRMVCSNGGFPQLCGLEFSKLDNLEEWIVEEGSMPCLRALTINECKKLKELPYGLRYITSLKELTIKGMKREWAEKLFEGGQDYFKVQHIPFVQFVKCDV
ncbi:unnamed protein product [Arabis nemorensis]|uniref:NB-ARC domain-containing protein n=1 Tax=Arabis nemorensis TaxID=586526 RepID=A0A565AQ95_9BRAS|nr:unnamed protein product [Arabis nemorensis]